MLTNNLERSGNEEREREREKQLDLGVGDVSILANLGGGGGAELGDGGDFVEVVDVDDGWDGSAHCFEEIDNSVPRFLQTR